MDRNGVAAQSARSTTAAPGAIPPGRLSNDGPDLTVVPWLEPFDGIARRVFDEHLLAARPLDGLASGFGARRVKPGDRRLHVADFRHESIPAARPRCLEPSLSLLRALEPGPQSRTESDLLQVMANGGPQRSMSLKPSAAWKAGAAPASSTRYRTTDMESPRHVTRGTGGQGIAALEDC
jgi:hypothetical protein